MAHKKVVVTSLTKRVKNIPTTSGFRSKELKQVTSVMLVNFYPKRFMIYSSIPKRLLQGTTEPIKQVLNNYNIRVAFKPHQTIDSDRLYIGETKREFNDQPHRTPKSGQTKKTPRNLHSRTLRTNWSRYLVLVVHNTTY